MKYLSSLLGVSLLITLSVVAFSPVSAAGPPKGKKEKINGKTLQEYAPYNLLFTVSTGQFDALLDAYETAGLSMDQIAGFTFIPERRYYTASEIAGANDPAGGDDPTPGGDESVDELPDPPTHPAPQGPANDNRPGVYQTIGFRVFLTYWVEETGSTDLRGIRFYGLTNNAEAFSLNALPESTEYFLLINDQPDEYNAVEDRQKLEEITEFELSFLPYDEYLYLAEGMTFYPTTQQSSISAADRGLIIERAAVAQSFSLATGNMDSLFQYRTLSFRPSPQPDWGSNEESSIAFSYGYYCPPYWQEDDGITSTENLIEGGALLFQNPNIPDDSAYTDRLLLALGNILDRHLERAGSTVEAFYEPPTPQWPEWLNWLIGLALLLIGIFVGNQFNKPVTTTN